MSDGLGPGLLYLAARHGLVALEAVCDGDDDKAYEFARDAVHLAIRYRESEPIAWDRGRLEPVITRLEYERKK